MGKGLRVCSLALSVATIAAFGWWKSTYVDFSERWEENKFHKRDTTGWLVVHHDAITHPTTADAIQIWHLNGNGWESGIAYTFYLQGGKIYQCKKIDQSGGHAYFFNHNAVSLCVHTPDKYELRTRINLWLLSKFLMLRYDLDTSKVRGHGELPGNSTTCPDMNMDSLRQCLADPLLMIKNNLTIMAKLTKEVYQKLAYGYTADGTVIDFTDTPIEEDGDEIEEESGDYDDDSNEFQTEFERDSNEFQTSIERRSNDIQTLSGQSLNAAQRQTLAACIENSNKAATLPKHYVMLYADVVKLLNNRQFIKSLTGKPTLKHPFSVPKNVCNEIRKATGMGQELKNSMIYKINFCRLYERRFSPAAFYSVILFSIIVFGLMLWPKGPKAKVKDTPKIERKITLNELKTKVRKWETSHHYYFSGWRLTHDIENNAPETNLDSFLKQQSEIQGSSFSEPQKW